MTTAREGPAVQLIYATGYVEPRHPVLVAARTTAPVRAVLVDEGDRVRRGQPLVLLDADEQRMMLAQAAAQRVQTSLDEHRAVTLYGEGWIARAARDAAVAAAAGARAGEAAARARLDQMVVRAGISGIVLKREVQPGDLATPATTLLELGDPADLWVTATVDERDVPLLRIGQQALLKSDAWPGRVLHGRLTELTPGGDPTQRAFRARIVPDRSAWLPIGLSLEVNIVAREVPRAVLVPNAAIADGGTWVVINGRAERRAVRTGIVGSDATQITAGVSGGDTVIVNPPDGLKPGARVRAAAAR
ncbi:MAG: efflux RND transporter periplasmic adaptor subunit [Sphingomonas sp.]